MIVPKYPFRVEIEVTSVCNLSCNYCFAKPFKNIIPPLDNIEYLIDKTKREANPFELILLGGEPFVRKDILDILEFAKEKFHSSIGISTNGTLIHKLSLESIARLKNITDDAGIAIQISLDSINPEINNINRGFGELTLKGIEILEKNNIKFNVGIVVTSANYTDVLNTARKLLSYENLTSFNLEILQPTFSLSPREFRNLAIDYNSMSELHDKIAEEIKKQNKDLLIRGVKLDCTTLGEEQPLISRYEFKSCSAGLLRAGVLVNGNVTPCLLLRNVNVGNLYKETWKEIWNKSRERYLNLRTSVGQCTTENLIRKEESIKAKIKIKS